MTAPHIIDPAGLLGEALSQASPDLMRSLLQHVINALLSADANTTASQISHVIYRGHFSRCPKNVAIPTTQIQCLNESSRNYVRNCWLTAIGGHQGDAPNHTSVH